MDPAVDAPGGPTLPTLFVMIGLPAAGKTSRAKELEEAHPALRLTPDDWMIPLFGANDANGARDVLEGRFIWLAMRALRLGVSVVLDFGLWSKEERSALRHLAAAASARCELLFLDVEPEEQRRRRDLRFATARESTVPISDEDLQQYSQAFAVPDEDELAGRILDPPPLPYETWDAWAADRWPTSFG